MTLKIALMISLLMGIYLVTFLLTVKFKKSNSLNYHKFPHVGINKSGIKFYSTLTHRIKISNVKIMKIGDLLYVKNNEKVVIVSNVKDVKIYEKFLYFTGCGKVEISFDCSEFYKYFALEIFSEQFDLKPLKQYALIDLMNNDFELKFSKTAKKYIKIIENVLNISIFKEKIVVKQNNFKLSFVLSYKLNNRIKRIYINETL